MRAKLHWHSPAWVVTALALFGLCTWGESLEPNTLTFASVQYRATAVPSENLTQLRKLIISAARQGASAVVLPEHSLLGPFSEKPEEKLPASFSDMAAAQSERLLAGLAKENAIWIISSAMERGPDRKSFVINSVVFDHYGQMAKRQAKLLPRSSSGDGNAVPGNIRDLSSLDFPGGRIGVTSGDDIVKSIPRLAILGSETILVSASWEEKDVIKWRDLARDLAAKNHVNLVISNFVSPETPRSLWSAVISRDGGIITEAKSSENQAVVGNVSVRPRDTEAILGLPSIPKPTTFTPTVDDLELGRKLFSDGGLASDGKTSCAACHEPEHSFADSKKLAVGVHERTGHRNTPSLLNAAFKTFFGWDGTAETMEIQAQHALLGWAEMNRTLADATAYVNQSPAYEQHRTALGGKVEGQHLLDRMSAYIRTLVSGDAPFDRFYFAGYADAIDASSQRGLNLFRSKAKCASCHELKQTYALFSDNAFHNTGIGFHKRFEYLGYSGDGMEGNQATKNRFRGEYITPILRNIALTAPYMHDGSLATLEDVVDFYNRGGNPNPFLDSRLQPLNLTAQERADLVAFLKTLTSTTAEPQKISRRRK